MNFTHRLQVFFTNGHTLNLAYTETFEDPIIYGGVPGKQLEGVEVMADKLRVYRADGSETVCYREHIIAYTIMPWKELPDDVKAQLELAKARPSPKSIN